MAVSLSERQLAGRMGAHRSWSRTSDRSARTEPAREAFRDRFRREVDPEGVLDPEERERRAESARRAWYAELALKSAKARRKASDGRATPEEPSVPADEPSTRAVTATEAVPGA